MRCLSLLVGCVALGSLGLPALGQDAPPNRPPVRPVRPDDGSRPDAQPRRAAPLTAEETEAAWKLEAIGVAGHIGADDAKTAEVAKAYIQARKSHDAAAEKIREERRAGGGGGPAEGAAGGGRGQEFLAAIQTLAKSEGQKLEKSLSGILSADQTARAMASLGTFYRPWDQMVHTIAGFGLDSSKQQDALNAVEEYVVVQATTVMQRGPDRDREAAAAAARDSRAKLTEALKAVLTDEQMKKFDAALGSGARQRGPRPDGGGQGGGGN